MFKNTEKQIHWIPAVLRMQYFSRKTCVLFTNFTIQALHVHKWFWIWSIDNIVYIVSWTNTVYTKCVQYISKNVMHIVDMYRSYKIHLKKTDWFCNTHFLLFFFKETQAKLKWLFLVINITPQMLLTKLNLGYSFKYLHCSHSFTCSINCLAALQRISSIDYGWLLMNWCIFRGLSALSYMPCEDKHSKAASNLFGIALLTVWVASASVN